MAAPSARRRAGIALSWRVTGNSGATRSWSPPPGTALPQVHPLPPKRQDLSPAHPRVEPKQQQVPVYGVVHRRLYTCPPARQHLGRRRYPPPCLAVVAPTRREPLLHRIAQTLVVHAGPTVDRVQERQALVCGHRVVALGQEAEAALDVAAGDGIKRAGEPVAEIEASVAAISPVGAGRAAVARDDVVLAGLAQCRQGTRVGALARGVVACGDDPQKLLGQAPCPVRGDPSDAADDDALVGRLAPAVAGAVVDKEGLRTRGMDAHTEAGKLVVPGDPGLVFGLESVYGALGQCELGNAFCGFYGYASANLRGGVRRVEVIQGNSWKSALGQRETRIRSAGNRWKSHRN